MLVQKDGKWVFVSRKTRRPLAYYRGEGKPSDEWVAKQERRVQYFKHLGESLEDFYSKKNPPPMFHVVRNYYHLTDKGYKEHEIINHFNKTFGMKLKKGDIEKHIVKNIQTFKKIKEEVKPDILPKSGAGQDGTDELVKTYMKDTPGQSYKRFKDYIK
jgi:hypothetical protein